jgi:hypothetical protein
MHDRAFSVARAILFSDSDDDFDTMSRRRATSAGTLDPLILNRAEGGSITLTTLCSPERWDQPRLVPMVDEARDRLEGGQTPAYLWASVGIVASSLRFFLPP